MTREEQMQKSQEIIINNLAVISEQLKRVANVNERKITDGSTRIPYQEVTLTIGGGERVDFFEVFNYFRVLEQTGGALSIKVGDNGGETPFTAAGVGVKFQEQYRRITLINTSGVSMTLTFAIALGDITDDRLTVSGTVNVAETDASRTGTTVASAAITANSTGIDVSAASATKRQVIIKSLSTNTITAYIGTTGITSSNGIELLPGESIVLDTSALIRARTASGTANLRVMEISN